MIDSMQLSSIMMNYGRYTENKTSGREQVNSFSGVLKSKSATSVDAVRTQETAGTEKVSLENMLKAKYPNLVYNVGMEQAVLGVQEMIIHLKHYFRRERSQQN